jgi:hypothetical protein
MDVSEIEKRVDRAIASPMPIDGAGRFAPANFGEAVEYAKLMAMAGILLPKYLRGNVGACLGICQKAWRLGIDPYAFAEKTYMVSNKGEERVGYEAQLVHAIITALAPLKNRLRYEIVGEGDERRCKVWGTFRNETEPHVYTSETLGKLRDARGRNEYGSLKGSPLWDTQPEVQLAYSGVRQWARLFASETILGIYTPDEFDNEPRDVTPPTSAVAAFSQRLKDAKRDGDQQGFTAGHAASVIENEPQEAVDNDGTTERIDPETGGGGQRDDADAASVDDDRAGSGRGDQTDASSAPDAGVGSEAAPKVQAQSEADIFPPDRKPRAKGKGK